MRHGKHTFKLGRNGSHRRALIANLLKNLILHDKIETTPAKAKELRRYADRMITLAKRDTLATRRMVVSKLMIRKNSLTRKETILAKKGDLSAYNGDRKILSKLFGELKDKYQTRAGGYTRIVRTKKRIGDNAENCIIEYI